MRSPSGDTIRRLNCQKIFAGRRQDFTPAGRDCDHVLDPNAPFAGEVYSRLDRDDHPRLQNFLLPLGDSRRFVNFEANSVPGGMGKITSQPGLSQYLTSGLVDFADSDARPHSVNRSLLTLFHRLVGPARFIRYRPDPHGTRLIRAITFEYNTEVADDESTGGDGLVRSAPVRQSRAGS